MSGIIDKIFGNKVVDDSPFPEIPVHTHDGQNSPMLAPQSIDSMQIKTGAVGDSQLMDLSVTEQKLADLAVATQKIRDDAITSAKVYKAGSVITLSAQIAEAIIATAHIQDLAVKWAKIGNLEVGNSKIMNLAVSTGKIQDLAVEWAKIGDLTVGNSKIMNAAITNAKIADLAVDNAKISYLSADKIIVGVLQGITVRTGQTSGGYVAMETGGSYPHSFAVYAAGGMYVGRMTYAGGALALVAMGDMEVNAGAILPYQNNVVDLGSSSLKFNSIYRTNEFSCPLPTSNSAIGVFKKIKKPQVDSGDFGERHYFKVEDFPAEMKAKAKNVEKANGKIEEIEDIELTRALGVTVQAVRELIEKSDDFEQRIAAVENKK
jgi:hypothetical protein